MPLVFRREPPEVAETVKIGLNRMASGRAFSTPRLARTIKERPTPPVPSQALPVYNIGLTDLAKSRDLTAAVQTSWRYLLRHDNEVIASADAVVGPDRKPAFAQVNEGPLVGGTVRAIQTADAQEEVKKGKYEVRLLMVPALYTAALWLVDTTGGRDLAVPLDPAPPPLIANKLISAKELLLVLQEAAKAALAARPAGEPIGT